ncbi:hypothetical protein HanRHA438_Chr06g0255601 [Helianthus annuus]|uniref:Uncharacterized protein n=2 Tax=Helianthus annuus TaxID=4232 RepID=A0A9K3IR61_HELAN|nr:hypothetical protein HanXRQr2_Chr06g0246471 [Helianthus annuus]KAJ0572585.1 hypothetical protein HanHA89_Chr06g0217331 [Helianthus annuus]KAJ0779393.1 hypothetical protein HanPI659440_Chr06g0225991 [Helianthus annuus]KAJ0910740.1 hypothetical protein HanRHA438_Chr06g0255601 [Helianthus annuus]
MIIIDFGKTMGCGLGKRIGDRCRRLKMKMLKMKMLKMKKVDIFKKSLSSLVLVLKRPSQL